MLLSNKIASGLILAVLLLVAAMYVSQSLIIVPRFFVVSEKTAVEKDLRRVVDGIHGELDHLETFARDWANWDDTYKFIDDRNEEYITANLQPTTFQDAQLNLIMFVGEDGRLVWGEAHIPANGAATPLAVLNEERPRDDPSLRQVLAAGAAEPIHDIVSFEQDPMLVVALPVYKTSREGDARGILVMGRLLDAQALQMIQRRMGLHFTLLPPAPEGLPQSEQGALEKAIAEGTPQLVTSDSRTLFAYQAYSNIDGEPVFVVRLEFPRTIMAEGKRAVTQAMLLSLCVALALLVAMALFVRWLLRPIYTLVTHAQEVRTSKDLSKRVHIKTKDEIGILAHEFDQMLARMESMFRHVQHVDESLASSDTQFRSVFERVSLIVVVLLEDGTITFCNSRLLDLTGGHAMRSWGETGLTAFCHRNSAT